MVHIPLLRRFEDPCSPDESGQGIFDRKERCHFVIRSLTPPQAAGNALAYAVQGYFTPDRCNLSMSSTKSEGFSKIKHELCRANETLERDHR
jgi:hypothetical protein